MLHEGARTKTYRGSSCYRADIAARFVNQARTTRIRLIGHAAEKLLVNAALLLATRACICATPASQRDPRARGGDKRLEA